MNSKLSPVILCGGTGTGLWPLSRATYPKQYWALVGENQSTYIPLGSRHRLTNPGRIPVEMIEVQSGPYLGEDDIVRFEDRYGRTGSLTKEVVA